MTLLGPDRVHGRRRLAPRSAGMRQLQHSQAMVLAAALSALAIVLVAAGMMRYL